MASAEESKKPPRVYNRDRVARIKEAAKERRGGEEEEERGLEGGEGAPSETEGRKTPAFLREREEAPSEGGSRRLTVNELTSCTQDSSQLATLMGGGRLRDDQPCSNFLEQSRRNKMMEREETNRKAAESLDRASKNWHTHMKGLDRDVSTLDSKGVKMSLFNDNSDLMEKNEKEISEKLNKRYGTDFSGRLDILLQRGLRTPWLSKSTTNLRSINERSHNRWSNKLDKFSSVWDLKYSLLHNRVNSNARKNHYTPSMPAEILRKNDQINLSTIHSSSNFQQTPFNQPSNYSNPFINNSVYQSNTNQRYPPIFQQPLNQYVQPNTQFNTNFPLNTHQENFPNSQYCTQPSIPFQIHQAIPSYSNQQFNNPQYSHNYTNMPYLHYSQNQAFTNSSNSPYTPNINEPYINYEPSNNVFSDSFDTITQKISDLTEKLESLNCVVNDLTLNHVNANMKPIIKRFGCKENNDENETKGKEKNCNIYLRTVSSSDRRVRFESPELYGNNICNIQSEGNEEKSKIDCLNPEEVFKNIQHSAHPQSVIKRYNETYQKNKDFKTFVLPPEASSVMMSRTKRNIHKYFREGK